jgi:hypothetical protein
MQPIFAHSEGLNDLKFFMAGKDPTYQNKNRSRQVNFASELFQKLGRVAHTLDGSSFVVCKSRLPI